MADQPEVTIEDVVAFIAEKEMPAADALSAIRAAFKGKEDSDKRKAHQRDLAIKRGLSPDYASLCDIELINGFILAAKTIGDKTAYFVTNEGAGRGDTDVVNLLKGWGLNPRSTTVTPTEGHPYDTLSLPVNDVMSALSKAGLPFEKRYPKDLRITGFVEFMANKPAVPAGPVSTATTS